MKRRILTQVALVAAISLGSIGASSEPFVIEGEARVIDGSTLEIWGQRIRLWGVTVAEAETAEGERAAQQLRRLLADVVVRCQKVEEDSLAHLTARCYVGTIDIAWPMVLMGFAEDDPNQSGGLYSRTN